MLTCLENGKWDGTSIKCNPICGRPTAKTSAYVIGGQDAKISDVPWSAGIYQLYRKKFKHICGGTILTKRIIISAAHCFFIEKKRQFASPDQFKVAVGKYFRGFYVNESLPIQTFNVTEIIAIPHYSGYASSYTRDIAIIILDGSINFEPHIIPICIDIEAGYESETTLSAGSIGLVAGWGYTTATGMPSDTLKSIEMPVIDFYQCLNESGDYRPFVTPDKFCSGFKNGSGVCQGNNYNYF